MDWRAGLIKARPTPLRAVVELDEGSERYGVWLHPDLDARLQPGDRVEILIDGARALDCRPALVSTPRR